MSDIQAMNIFDRAMVRRHRDRAATGLHAHDFLFAEVAERLVDRLDDIKRTFPTALDLGCHGGEVGRGLEDRGGIETLFQCDLSEGMAGRAGPLSLVADEEALPFKAGAFDLVLSNLSLHWVNDLPGAFVQVRKALKDDGLFLGAMLGGETLRELRSVLFDKENELEGGMSPRISPFAGVKDVGDLLHRAGFAMPVVDSEAITVTYADPLRLMADLRGMGETNAVLERRKTFSRRKTLLTAASHYMETFADEDGRIPATFQIIYFAAWTPDPSQPQPLKPGSGAVDLVEALKG